MHAGLPDLVQGRLQFTCSFIHSFSKHLLITYCMPDLAPGAWDISEETDACPP